MAKKCQVTGRRPAVGMTYTIRGIAKKKKGIGLNIVGKDRRRFHPNVFKKRFWYDQEDRYITLRLCAGAMRTIDKKGLPAIVQQLRAEGQKI